jgi:STAM-binding protein
MLVSMTDPRSQAKYSRPGPLREGDKLRPPLKPVEVPSEVLKRFVAISAANTESGIEALGLLLGKFKRDKYVATTLLILRQRGSRDWCVMEEEEVVLQFTERRFLVTLGWIYTHPTQSCEFSFRVAG